MTRPAQAAAAPKPASQELVSFRIGDQEFAVDIGQVREIRGWTEATPLPHAPPYVRGTINLRGTVLPIIELATRLGLPATGNAARKVIVVVQVGGGLLGLLVDAVSDVLTVTDHQVQPTPPAAGEPTRSLVHGLLPQEGRMVSLISLDQLVPAAA